MLKRPPKTRKNDENNPPETLLSGAPLASGSPPGCVGVGLRDGLVLWDGALQGLVVVPFPPIG